MAGPTFRAFEMCSSSSWSTFPITLYLAAFCLFLEVSLHAILQMGLP